MELPLVWDTLDLRNAVAAAHTIQLLEIAPEYVCKNVRVVNLEFAAGLRDDDLQALRRLQLKALNLNACQR